jgi:gluconolactonase
MSKAAWIEDVREPEGPVWAPDGSLYLVEMEASRRCVTHIERSGQRRVVATTVRRPNGLAIDGDGRLWVAEGYEGAVLCYAPDGTLLKRIAGDADGRFLWPNDLAFGADGRLYMTDSGIREEAFIDGLTIRRDYATASYDGRVYEIDPSRGIVLRKIDAGIKFTNGIAFGSDGRLYVNETITGAVFRYTLRGDRPAREMFGNVTRTDLPPGFRGPDGMKFGADGRLYCTVYGQGDVTVLDEKGQVAERLATKGSKPTNLAFALDTPRMAVSEVEGAAIELIATRCLGLPLHYPKFALR